MSVLDRSQALDHVVVVMFENRSFDNLLGRLYEPGEVPSFEGVIGKDLANPVPSWAEDGADRGPVPYAVAPTMDTPNPDPGEEYQHLNTQLFGTIDPPDNRGVLAERMLPPYNAPAEAGRVPTMDGFVTDYISAFTAETGRRPTYDEYAQIMTGYTPAQMPVLSALARGFTTFDHWFCEVPSQTFTNRSFFHAGTASGYVVNMSPIDSFPVHNTAETVFDRLDANGLTWRVYCSPPARLPFTGIIHAARLRDRFDHFHSTDRFLEDAANGTLPTYSFVEPALIYGHNDMHPPEGALFPGLSLDTPSSLLGGEALLAQLYDAVRTSASPTGSNAYNTLFLVTFDEAGGTYDHVPPPSAAPPEGAAPAGQYGFRFDRLGIRVPAVAVSAWAPGQTVVTDLHHSTSLIRALRERWSLGAPFSGREATAPDLGAALSLRTPRDPADWPEVHPRPVPAFTEAVLPPDRPLCGLPRSLFFAFLGLGRELGQSVPDIAPDADLTGGEGLAMLHEMFGHLFPNLRDGR
ncbi:alkaline phosphatase family protein [Kitasatospora sp. NPDC048365]|uniref:alkaline phosphatase family protein n=1 Tax=Kitasatospora sp. NPDC048365 TaxID=3364050 RepID=UPI00371E5D90